MSSVHIGIRHDDDFVVAEFGYIKIVMNTCSNAVIMALISALP